MRIVEIYLKYQIPRSLQMHMLRVAAVAHYISTNFLEKVDIDHLVRACLLHDMGNILKFDFHQNAALYAPEGPDYWREVQLQFRLRYGSDEHHATVAIMRDIGVCDRVFEIYSCIGFRCVDKCLNISDYACKIANYSDQRVSPFGVVPLHDRLLEARNRFIARAGDVYDAAYFDKNFQRYDALEEQIFSLCRKKPFDICDLTITPYIGTLQLIEI